MTTLYGRLLAPEDLGPCAAPVEIGRAADIVVFDEAWDPLATLVDGGLAYACEDDVYSSAAAAAIARSPHGSVAH